MKLLPLRLRFLPRRDDSAPLPPPRFRRRRSRQVLGYSLLFAVVLHLTLAMAMESRYPQWRDPEYGHRLKQFRAIQAASPVGPVVVMLGSSRTQMGVSPAEMSTSGPVVFNFAHSGAGPVHLSILFRRMLRDSVKPEAMLIEYMPLAFHPVDCVEDLLKPWMPSLSHADIEGLAPYRTQPGRMETAWARVRFNPFSSMRLSLLSHTLPGWLPWPLRQDYRWTMTDRHGWTPYPYRTITAEHRGQNQARAYGEYQNGFTNLNMGRWTKQAYRDMIADCQARGIRVAIYTMPESPVFRSCYSPESARQGEAFLKDLSRDLGVPVFDATAGFTEEDFADGHHMMRHAAQTFSRRLWQEHIEPWLRK